MSILETDDFDFKRKSLVHIRNQQRRGKKSITLVEGLPLQNMKDLLRKLKKKLNTNGTILSKKGPKDTISVLQVQGDFRYQIQEYFINEKITDKELIIVHG